jgi:hypothetical protein
VILEIGRDLVAMKERLGHGHFGRWLLSEFRFTERTAQNYMRAFQEFGDKPEIVAVLPAPTVYLLAGSSTPQAVREEIVQRVEAGERPAANEIYSLVQSERARSTAEKQMAKLEKLSPEQRKELERKEKSRVRSKERREAEAQRQCEEAAAARLTRETAGRAAAELVRDVLGARYSEFLALLDDAGPWEFAAACRQVQQVEHVIETAAQAA